MKKAEFGSDFEYLLDNVTFPSPFIAELDEEFGLMLNRPDEHKASVYPYQTIGGLDTVYIPPERESEEPEANFVNKLEEQYHIEQLRSNSAGWFLERLSRTFTQLVQALINQTLPSKALPELLRAFVEYKMYCESVRWPLEFQARVRFHLYFHLSECMPQSKKPNLSFLLGFPAGLGKAEETLSRFHSFKQYHTKNIENFWKNVKMDILDSANFFTSYHYLGDKLISAWFQKVGEVCKSISKKLTNPDDKLLLRLMYGNLLEIPAFIALNPPTLAESGKCKKKEEALQSDPRTRFYESFFALVPLSQDALENTLKKSLQLKSGNLFGPINKMAIEKISENKIPYMNMGNYVMQIRKKAKPSNLESINPLLALRPIENLPQPTSTCGFVSDDSAPSIKISRTGKSFIAKIENDDLISMQFLKDLQLLNKGVQIMNQANWLSELKQLEASFKYTTKQRFILTLYYTPHKQISLNKQREIAYALDIPDWPVELDELPKVLSIPIKEIENYKLLLDYSESNIYPLVYDLLLLLSDSRNEDQKNTFKDVLEAFDEANLLNEDRLIEICKHGFYGHLNLNKKEVREDLNEIVFEALKSPHTYTWENLIKEIECMNQELTD